ncbi:MAG: M48 family peptidase, partial [Betaproteobacteria bacterium]|nr:M48 family peptidase [Betaproteobacteria bacterium]
MLTKRAFLHQCAGCAAGLFTFDALAREGVEVGSSSQFAKLVSAADIEQTAIKQYGQMLKQANEKEALAPEDHPQLIRLRAIAHKLIPFSE